MVRSAARGITVRVNREHGCESADGCRRCASGPLPAVFATFCAVFSRACQHHTTPLARNVLVGGAAAPLQYSGPLALKGAHRLPHSHIPRRRRVLLARSKLPESHPLRESSISSRQRRGIRRPRSQSLYTIHSWREDDELRTERAASGSVDVDSRLLVVAGCSAGGGCSAGC